MKAVVLALALACLDSHACAAGNPLNQVIEMLSDLQAKNIKAGREAQTEYEEAAEFCEEQAREIGSEVKAGKAEVEDLTATIEEQKATIAKLTTRVENLAKDSAADDADLKAAAEVRKKEHTSFIAEEKDLVDTVEEIKRAIVVIEKELQGGASMVQLQNAGDLTSAMSVMLQASLIRTSDARRLTAFVQAAEGSESSAHDLGSAAYENKGSSLIDTLQDLLDKASSQLDEARNKETKSRNDYEMLKQSLEAEMKLATKDLGQAKKGIATATELQSNAEGDLTVAKKELAEDVRAHNELHHDCMTKAKSFETETKSRGEELAVLAKAKKIISESIGGASLSQVSFVQILSRLSGSNRGMDRKALEAMRLVRDLGHKEKSASLMQLASKMAVTMRGAGRGTNPFEKIKDLISGMISKLENAGQEDATKNAYCQKELAETEVKKDDKADDVEETDTKGEQKKTTGQKLGQRVSSLQHGLSKLTKAQAEMDKLRSEEKFTFAGTKAEAEKGLQGVQTAIKVLKDYYSKSENSSGAADAIIALLEDTESKLTAWIADMVSDEETAINDYKSMTNENEVDKATKETDVSHKTKEIKEVDKTVSELATDENGFRAELGAVTEYEAKIKAECVAKPESYEERKKRREEEMAGLKEALDILENEASLIQRRASRKRLRGTTKPMVASA